MKITLNHNIGFKWYSNDAIYFKGYFFVGDLFYEKEQALKKIESLKTQLDFLNFLKICNGTYSIIYTIGETVYISSDITRSFPIFYASQNNEFVISDDIIHIKKELNFNEFDEISEIEIIASLHTYGKKTLLNDVYQVQSSECLLIHPKGKIESFFTFNYSIENESNFTKPALKEEGFKVIENSFKRLISSLDNKTVVIPLSGGFDSRLIAVLLKKHNYKNVICFTYGNKNSFEIENSKKVANVLGYDWHFIEYNTQLTNNYLKTKEFKKYAHFAGKLSSMPNLQEFFAVKHLTDKKIIPKNSIFIPGYAGDLLGGSQFLKIIPENLKTEDIVDLILTEKFTNLSVSIANRKKITNEIERILISFDIDYKNKIPVTVFEDFDIKEKIAKYIFNSANFYTFFGHEFRFPFWDKEMLDFFKAVPIKHKKMKSLFDEILIDYYFKKFRVHFKNELQPTEKNINTQKIKDFIKPILPTFIKHKFLEKNDWNNYKPITNAMLISLKKNNISENLNYKSYNEIIVKWYLNFCKNNME